MLKLPQARLLRAWGHCIVSLVLCAIIPAFGGPSDSQVSEDFHPQIRQSVDDRSGGRAGQIVRQGVPSVGCRTSDGKYLFLANCLPTGRADTDEASAVINIVDWAQGRTIRKLPLPNGGNLIAHLAISPDGRFIAATHTVAGFNRATTHLHNGWLNANGLTLIDVPSQSLIGTVLLDERAKGAANPCGVAWNKDETTLIVTHSGTHEISIIDFPVLLDELRKASTKDSYSRFRNSEKGSVLRYHVVYEGIDPGLPFLEGARKRLKLPEGDLGPREIAVIGNSAYVTNYFSQTVTVMDLANPEAVMKSFPLTRSGKAKPGAKSMTRSRAEVLSSMSLEKRGEFYFHDAATCLEGWQSCASCHPNGARADGLNWDLLNDGFGNPKNTKSLLLSFKTPPAMSTGVRESAHDAVVAGLKGILFTEPKEEIVTAIEAYIRSLKPAPSPWLVKGKLSRSAARGKSVFAKAGCADCHSGSLFTDLSAYDVGTRGPHDRPTDTFDTPTLIEVWRTAPYLHDGSAATIRDVLTHKNKSDQHGTTSKLSEQEISDLCEYVLSL